MAETGSFGSFGGGLEGVVAEGELFRREGPGQVFGELDFQAACQAYLWA